MRAGWRAKSISDQRHQLLFFPSVVFGVTRPFNAVLMDTDVGHLPHVFGQVKVRLHVEAVRCRAVAMRWRCNSGAVAGTVQIEHIV